MKSIFKNLKYIAKIIVKFKIIIKFIDITIIKH